MATQSRLRNAYQGPSSGSKDGVTRLQQDGKDVGKYRTWYQSRWLDQREDRSRCNPKLDNIRLKKLRSNNKRLELMDLKKDQQYMNKVFVRKMKRSRCYVCKIRGHAYWNCPTKEQCKDKGKGVTKKVQVEDETGYVQKYKEKIEVLGEYMVKGTDGGDWNEIWYVSNKYPRHMTPNRDLFLQSKSSFSVDTEVHNTNFLFTNGFGEISLKTNDNVYIPYVSYIPEIGINVFSMQQLVQQGYIVEVKNMECTVKYMFEDKGLEVSNEEVYFLEEYCASLDESTPPRKDIEIITKYRDNLIGNEMEIEKEDFICLNGIPKPIVENSYSRFMEFMRMTNEDKITMKNRDMFQKHFERMVKWFHERHNEGTVLEEIPPKLVGIEICLFDVYKLVKCLGSYENVTMKGKWEEILMGFGFPACYHKKFKKMYEMYLLLPEAHYEYARDGPAWSGCPITPQNLQDIGDETNKNMAQEGDSECAPKEVNQEASLGNKAKGVCNKAITQSSSSKESDPASKSITMEARAMKKTLQRLSSSNEEQARRKGTP